MDIQAKLRELGITSVLVVDDAFESPRPARIGAEAKARFLDHVHETETCGLQLRERFPNLDSEMADAAVLELLSNEESLGALWRFYRNEPDVFGWLSVAFEQFEQDLNFKRNSIAGLEAYLRDLHFNVTAWDGRHDNQPALTHGLIFLDLFLVERDPPDPDADLQYAANIAALFAKERTVGSVSVQPIVVLISSREQRAREMKERFRELSGIKGSFFRFLEKSALADSARISSMLEEVLEQYPSARQLAAYLDTLAEAAHGAVKYITTKLGELELTDLALLNQLRLVPENETLGAYCNWLFAEGISTATQTDTKLRKASAQLTALERLRLDGHVGPRNVLFDLYARAVARTDVRDEQGSPRSDSVAFGDIFREDKVQSEGTTTSIFHVALSPDCTMLRCEADYQVLCVQGEKADRIDDVKRWTASFGPSRHLLEFMEDNQSVFRVIKWDLDRIRTISMADLRDSTKYCRVARLHAVFSHQLKEDVLRELGRVAIPIAPSPVQVYDAQVRLIFGDQDIAWTPQGIYAAILTMQYREREGLQRVLCFSRAFVTELKAKVQAEVPGAGVAKPSFDKLIAACGTDIFDNVTVAKDSVMTVVNQAGVKILIDTQSSGARAFCEISLVPVDTH